LAVFGEQISNSFTFIGLNQWMVSDSLPINFLSQNEGIELLGPQHS